MLGRHVAEAEDKKTRLDAIHVTSSSPSAQQGQLTLTSRAAASPKSRQFILRPASLCRRAVPAAHKAAVQLRLQLLLRGMHAIRLQQHKLSQAVKHLHSHQSALGQVAHQGNGVLVVHGNAGLGCRVPADGTLEVRSVFTAAPMWKAHLR